MTELRWRQLHGLTRFRSTLAGFAALFAFYPFQLAMDLIHRGMFGTQVPGIG